MTGQGRKKSGWFAERRLSFEFSDNAGWTYTEYFCDSEQGADCWHAFASLKHGDVCPVKVAINRQGRLGETLFNS
jgi:hypothetical protein